MRVGRAVYNSLKGGGTEKRGEKTKILKRGSSWVKGWVPFIKRGLEPPYELWKYLEQAGKARHKTSFFSSFFCNTTVA